MYLYGHTDREICEKFGIKEHTLKAWIKKYRWEELKAEVMAEVHKEGIRPYANKASMLSRQGLDIIQDQLKVKQAKGEEMSWSEMKQLMEMALSLYKIGNIEQGKPTEITQQQSLREMKLELKKIVKEDPFQEFLDVTPEKQIEEITGPGAGSEDREAKPEVESSSGPVKSGESDISG